MVPLPAVAWVKPYATSTVYLIGSRNLLYSGDRILKGERSWLYAVVLR